MHMTTTVRQRHFSLPFLLVLTAIAWLALIVWSLSSYRIYLSHDVLESLALTHPQPAAMMLLGWGVMVVAMMLPGNLGNLLAGRPTIPATGILLAGYLAIWMAFGTLLFATDLVIHRVVQASSTSGLATTLLAPLSLILAGAYQRTRRRARCLSRLDCPSGVEDAAPFRAGVRTGVICLGCSWPLMLVMFAIGHGNLIWMFLLATVMTIERLTTWGRQMSSTLGPALIVAGVALLLISGSGMTH